MKPVILETDRWQLLRDQLRKDNAPSVMLSRDKMRRVLGFTPRNHKKQTSDGPYGAEYHKVVCLDFFDEQKRTMFLLKYSDWIKQ